MAISLGKVMGIYSWLGVPLNFSDRLLEVDFFRNCAQVSGSC